MTCYINKATAVAIANEVSEYLERYASLLAANATVELEELGERVLFALVSGVTSIAGDRQSEIQMTGHVLFGAMHAGIYSALTAVPAARPEPTTSEITVN